MICIFGFWAHGLRAIVGRAERREFSKSSHPTSQPVPRAQHIDLGCLAENVRLQRSPVAVFLLRHFSKVVELEEPEQLGEGSCASF